MKIKKILVPLQRGHGLSVPTRQDPHRRSSRGRLNVIAFGAHPDDCDIKMGGTAAKFAAAGHPVKFVALTSGDNGHPVQAGGQLSQRRRAEASEAARRLGIEAYEVWDIHGGELVPSIEIRRYVVNAIRNWQADIVVGHRPYDYHPDHRYAAMLLQDAAYMVTVPHFSSSVPALIRNPLFLYFEDPFLRPTPLRPDVVVPIGDFVNKKLEALDAHASQMYEWDPFMEERRTGLRVRVPKAHAARLEWLRKRWLTRSRPAGIEQALSDWYGEDERPIQYAEAFEVCEYGAQPSPLELRSLFAF